MTLGEEFETLFERQADAEDLFGNMKETAEVLGDIVSPAEAASRFVDYRP